MIIVSKEIVFNYIKNNVDQHISKIIDLKVKGINVEVKYFTEFINEKPKKIDFNIENLK